MSIDTIVYETKANTTRIALLGDGELKEIEIIEANRALEGNIYLGKISKKIDLAHGKQGFFVDLGEGRDAFLNAEEYGLDELKICEGQSLVVQVAQEKRAEKGPKVTRALQFVGESLVYCPYKLAVETSSKIEDRAKAEAYRQLVLENTIGQEGWIVRTAAVNETEKQILDEMAYLRSLFENVRQNARKLSAPALLLAKTNPVFEYINKYFLQLKKVVLNSRNVEEEIKNRFSDEVATEIDAQPFETFGLEDAIVDALNKTVQLKCGGRLTIEETKAFVAIDVDSGHDNGKGSLTHLNEEAAVEIAKQIRLRNLSGKIIIDFAGASDYRFLKSVIEVLEKEVAQDATRTSVLGLSRAGNVEVIRVRKRPTLQDMLTVECESCLGTGRVLK